MSFIGIVNFNDTSLMTFDLEQLTSRLPSHVDFEIKVLSHGMNIFQNFIEEGSSTCVMSLGFWKALGSPTLKPSHTILKAFDGHSFLPHGLITDFPIELGGKIVQVDVEVVDAPIYYNMLLGRSWIHAMTTVVSSVFRVI